MRTRRELEAQWAELRRLSADSDITRVVESLERAVGATDDEEPRRRLKVPYVNATNLDRGEGWN